MVFFMRMAGKDTGNYPGCLFCCKQCAYGNVCDFFYGMEEITGMWFYLCVWQGMEGMDHLWQ